MLAHVLAAALLACGLTAQQNVKWIDNNLPTGPGNAFPWGSNFIRYQAIFDAAMLGSTPGFVNDVLIAGDATDVSPREVVYDDIEIRLGNTPITHAGITSNWTTNNPNPTTVHRGRLRVVFEPRAWRGVGLPRAFLYVPLPPAPNLCFEVITWQVRGHSGAINFFYPTAGNVQRAYLYGWVANQTGVANVDTQGNKLGVVVNDGNWVVLGEGCVGSASNRLTITGPANAWPARGRQFPVRLTGGVPQRPSVCALGSTDATFGSVPLPYDLAPWGAGGCQLWSEPLVLIGTVTDASGNATLPLAIPADPTLSIGRAFATWVQVDPPANPMGVTFSGYMKLILDV